MRDHRAQVTFAGMRIALATHARLASTEIDDRPLHAALTASGAVCEQPIWDDPSVDFGRYDAVLLRTTWDYQYKLPEFLAWADRVSRVTRLFNPEPVVRWNTHKHYLRSLQAAGVPMAKTLWLDRGTRVDVDSLMREHGLRNGFIKPCVGATARETLPFSCDASGIAQAEKHLARLLPDEDLMLQPFLRSVMERGEWSAIFIDGELTHCVRKIPVPGDYRVQDDFGASDERYLPLESERLLAERVMALVTQASGPAPWADGSSLLYGRADFLWDDDGQSVLTELELVEPSLFFRHGPEAASKLAQALLRRLAE